MSYNRHGGSCQKVDVAVAMVGEMLDVFPSRLMGESFTNDNYCLVDPANQSLITLKEVISMLK